MGRYVSGIPYYDSNIHLMVRKIWKDVRKGRVLEAHVETLRSDTPVIPAPTTAPLKKSTDRAISTDARHISDLRCANISCIKEDYPEVHLANISEISEREREKSP